MHNLLRRRCWLYWLVLISIFNIAGCSTSPPSDIVSVTPFDINRYVGQWYEIARLDHSFERGLAKVSANYRVQANASVEVINRGYDSKKGTWRQAVGVALFTGDQNRASLKVSFFGPFYGGYHVVALDQSNYQWAMVVGQNRHYLWILSRQKTLDTNIRDQLLIKAQALGFDTQRLIWVEQ